MPAVIPVAISAEPEPPEGWEVFVSSAYDFPGRAPRRASGRAGLAPALDRGLGDARQDDDGRDDRVLPFATRPRSAFVVGGEDSRSSAGTRARGRGGWSPRATNRTGGRAAAARDRRRDQRRARPSHDVSSPAEVDACSSAGSRTFRTWCAAGSSIPPTSRWPCEGSTTGGTLPVRSPHSSCARSIRPTRRRCSRSSAARDGASSSSGSRAESRSTTIRAPSERGGCGDRGSARDRVRAVIAAFQPHLYSRTRHLSYEFAVALSRADAVCVTDIYAAREEPIEGVSGKLVVERWPRFARARRWAGRRASTTLSPSWPRAQSRETSP